MWLKIENKAGFVAVMPCGAWRLANIKAIADELRALALKTNCRVIIDGSLLSQIDTSSAMLLFRSLAAKGIRDGEISIANLQDAHRSILQLVRSSLAEPAEIKRQDLDSFVVAVGKNTLALGEVIRTVFAFLGRMTVETVKTVLEPRLLRTKELFVQLEETCLNALPIVCLVTFLIGIVLAYLFGLQMEQYGANIFVVDGLSIVICRELSPILVAIIVAGRSGSAFTAQVGTMKLNEEIDAMRTLGLSPLRILVVPRILALMIAMPILVFVGDVVGIVGGMLIANWSLDISVATFLNRLSIILKVKTLLVGLCKAPIYAFVIAAIGCHLGLSVENNARSVGLNTTATVVRSIVSVILLNAAFAIILSKLRI